MHSIQLKHDTNDRLYLGFWIYIMTDLLMFAVLFATYAVLRDSTHGGISIAEIFDPPFVMVETLILLTSSFVMGLAVLSALTKNKAKTLLLLAITGMLGVAFLGMELYEFNHLLSEGHSWGVSAFLSAFFALVGFHGLHILGGSVWLAILMGFIYARGLIDSNLRKLKLLSIFWHFLDIVWIFIFTIVYLFGGIL